ncbi:GntR family transcriptional regulator [Amycolatopsis acidicola]|uniref:GntR family transcriptional regulator n=1 Tax=Amycolatopsis acidicola TaxID=2596893 RepID=A0A5N0V361_9PSEU|nr:GntR family transcriptional regulator [Amycolatopsis acidicola]KAA9158061.1 GntR family transcriptional regulator [Amycolatopsis acidicola]
MTEIRVRHTNLRDQVLEVVQQAMVSGEIRPGDIYSASALAARLGVSSSPVREAMLALVHRGLMQPVRNRGFRVVEMSERDLDEVYEMRQLLEIPATLSAAAKAGPADLARLGALAGEIEAAAADGDVARFLEADRRFHLDLLALAGNRRLVDGIAALRDQTRLYGLEKLAETGRLPGAAAEHRELLAAIESRDLSILERLLRAHLEHTRADWAG